MVEHYVEHREFGLAFDILCDVVLPDKTLTNDDRTAMRRIGLQMGPIDEANFRLLPWLADKE